MIYTKGVIVIMEDFTREFSIDGDILIADTFFKRLCGFMFRKEPHYAVIMLKPCNSIHTHFMHFDIDILFLNEKNIVIKKVENLKPGKVIKPVEDAVAVIEAEWGVFEEINVGDRVIVS